MNDLVQQKILTMPDFKKVFKRPVYGHALVCLVGILVIVLAYYETWAALFQKYATSGTYAHGFLVFPIVLWLFYEKRKAFFLHKPQYTVWAFFGLTLLSLGWYMAHVTLVGIIQQFSVITMLITLFLGCFGPAITRQFLFPLSYLFFAIPFGNFLNGTLQSITAYFSIGLLNLFNVPVYFEGFHIITATGTFEVAEACGGVRYLIASVSLGVLFAYLTYHKWWKRLLFCFLCVIVPIVANGIRAFTIIMLAHFSNMKYAVGVDHLIYGWIFFGLIIGILFFIGLLWRDPVSDTDHKSLPKIKSQRPIKHAYMSLIMVVCLIPGAWLQNGNEHQAISSQHKEIRFPEGREGWVGPIPSKKAWQPVFHGPTVEKTMSYAKDQDVVDVYTAHYYSQSPQHELISERNHIFDPKDWALLDKNLFAFPDLNISSVYELNIHHHDDRRLVWYWYSIGGSLTANPIWGKLLEGFASLRQESTPIMVIAMSMPYEYYPDSARLHLEEFIHSMMPTLMEAFSKESDQ